MLNLVRANTETHGTMTKELGNKRKYAIEQLKVENVKVSRMPYQTTDSEVDSNIPHWN